MLAFELEEGAVWIPLNGTRMISYGFQDELVLFSTV